MAKFRAEINEERVYPFLGITVKPNEIVELPADTIAAGLVLVEEKVTKKSEPVAEATAPEGA
jgi:hypothetical protein